jgi:diaminohydroxyphosphoribosylaminopyrimidine deaminase/5-amino-6-(5-phosphoribosylamino)uracil reductase
MVGLGTVLADDPDLTCRIAGMRTHPIVRVVADSHLRTPHLSRLVATAAANPIWLLHRVDVDRERARTLELSGVSLLPIAAGAVGIDIAEALRALAAKGITRLMVEGGGKLAASLIRADLVDRITWFHAPAIMGGDGWPAVQEFGLAELAALRRFKPLARSLLGADLCSEYERSREGALGT